MGNGRVISIKNLHSPFYFGLIVWKASLLRMSGGLLTTIEDEKNTKTFCNYNDVIMGAIASQITSLTIVFSTVYSDAHQRKPQTSA